MKFEVTQYNLVDVAPGVYEATFQGCTGPVPTQYGEGIFWNFKVKQGDELVDVSGMSSVSFSRSSRCKAHRWARAIDPNFTIESNEWDDQKCIGLKCIVNVTYFDGAEGLRSTVTEVKPWANLQSVQK